MTIGDYAYYEGKRVMISDDCLYLPLLREITWIEDGTNRFKWVKVYELQGDNS